MRGSPDEEPQWLMRIVLGVVIAVTTAVALLPFVRYAYRAPELHIVIDTADAVIALIVAYLVYGRYRQSARLRDLLLASSLTLLAGANLPLHALPLAMSSADGGSADIWSALLVRMLGALLFAGAALSPPTRRITRLMSRVWVGSIAVVAASLVALGVVLAQQVAAAPVRVAADASRPVIDGHPAVLALQAVAFLLYAYAAYAFTRAAARERDELLRWLGAAAVLAAGARVNYFLFPSLYSDFLYTGDLLRLGFYLLLGVGAAREINSYWAARVVAAEARGRRGTVSELEDVVVPELREVVRLAETRTSSPDAVAEGARRALREAERVLAQVRREAEASLPENPFSASLRDAIAPVAERLGVAVDVNVEPGVDVPPQAEHVVALA